MIKPILLFLSIYLVSCTSNMSDHQNVSIPQDDIQTSDSSHLHHSFIPSDLSFPFFESYFDSIIAEINLKSGVYPLKVEGTIGSIDNKIATYATNFGFYGDLYEVQIRENDDKQFVAVISADENVWGSQYYLAIFDSDKKDNMLIDRIRMSNSIDSLRFRLTEPNSQTESIIVYFESDITSAIYYHGVHCWKLANEKLERCE